MAETALIVGPPRGDDWLFEVKWDGIRAIAFVEREEVRLQSRNGLRRDRGRDHRCFYAGLWDVSAGVRPAR